jgi:hypothetical protein
MDINVRTNDSFEILLEVKIPLESYGRVNEEWDSQDMVEPCVIQV